MEKKYKIGGEYQVGDIKRKIVAIVRAKGMSMESTYLITEHQKGWSPSRQPQTNKKGDKVGYYGNCLTNSMYIGPELDPNKKYYYSHVILNDVDLTYPGETEQLYSIY